MHCGNDKRTVKEKYVPGPLIKLCRRRYFLSCKTVYSFQFSNFGPGERYLIGFGEWLGVTDVITPIFTSQSIWITRRTMAYLPSRIALN